MRVYLAGPINGCDDWEAKDWRQWFKENLTESAFVFVDPMSRDYRGKERDNYREIVELDKRDIRSCDVVLVSHSKPSVGTSMEILFAWERGIPVLTIAGGSTASPWLLYHSTAVVSGLEEAARKLKEWL